MSIKDALESSGINLGDYRDYGIAFKELVDLQILNYIAIPEPGMNILDVDGMNSFLNAVTVVLSKIDIFPIFDSKENFAHWLTEFFSGYFFTVNLEEDVERYFNRDEWVAVGKNGFVQCSQGNTENEFLIRYRISTPELPS